MPCFFIDTDDGDTFVVDDEGLDLPDAEAAREIALRALPEIARDKTSDGDDRTFRASVRDEAGAVIYEATLTLTGGWKADQSAS